MKKIWIAILAIGFTNCGKAQSYDKLLDNITYCSVSINGKQTTIRLTTDSLIVGYNTSLTISTKSGFEITRRETIEEYFLVYVKLKARTRTAAASGLLPVGVYVFYFDKESNNLFVLNDNVNYTSIEDARKAVFSIPFKKVYFDIWYPESTFNTFLHYSDFKDANKVTMEKLVDSWIKEFESNKNIIQNMPEWRGHIPLYTQDFWTTALLQNHLNPIIRVPELYNKLIEDHVAAPSIRPVDNTIQLHLDSDYLKSKQIRINAPSGN